MFKKESFKKPNNVLESHPDSAANAVPSVPDELWQTCPGCRKMLLVPDLEQNLYVCTRCEYHCRMGAWARIRVTTDEGSFEEWDGDLTSVNRLDFPDYEAKLKKAKATSGLNEAVVTGRGKIEGNDCALCVMDADFMMGSMGTVVGEKITRLFERAMELQLPVIVFTLSGGARMQEGILSLMQMAKTSGAIKRHSDAGLLYITVLTDPTTGGVTASFAMEGDIILAEPQALIGFTGARIIEQTIRQKLPYGFQRAEFQMEKGFVDAIVPRNEMRETLGYILSLHGGGVK